MTTDEVSEMDFGRESIDDPVLDHICLYVSVGFPFQGKSYGASPGYVFIETRCYGSTV